MTFHERPRRDRERRARLGRRRKRETVRLRAKPDGAARALGGDVIVHDAERVLHGILHQALALVFRVRRGKRGEWSAKSAFCCGAKRKRNDVLRERDSRRARSAFFVLSFVRKPCPLWERRKNLSVVVFRGDVGSDATPSVVRRLGSRARMERVPRARASRTLRTISACSPAWSSHSFLISSPTWSKVDGSLMYSSPSATNFLHAPQARSAGSAATAPGSCRSARASAPEAASATNAPRKSTRFEGMVARAGAPWEVPVPRVREETELTGARGSREFQIRRAISSARDVSIGTTTSWRALGR